MVNFVVFSNIFFSRIMALISLGTTNRERAFWTGMVVYVRCRRWRNAASRRRDVSYKVLACSVKFFGVAVNMSGSKISSLDVIGIGR
jgi:hypothetical protein